MKQLLTGAVIAATLGLAGCGAGGALAGFTPMYADSTGIAPSLSRIEVANLRGRAGFILRDALDDALAKNRSEAPLYRLALTVKESRIARGLRVDNVANRYELEFRVTYALIDLSAGRTVTRGVLTSTVTYDSADQPYAAVAAHQDAQERAAEDAAQRLRLNLASYFRNPKAFGVGTRVAQGPGASKGGTISDRMSEHDVTSPSDKAEDTEDDPSLVEAQAPALGADTSNSDEPVQIPALTP